MASTNIGKTKRSTDDMIASAVNRQQDWLENRRAFTRKFLRIFNKKENTTKSPEKKSGERILRDYWFPILCAMLVILIAVFIMVFKINAPVKVIAPSVPEPVVRPVQKSELHTTPSFDMVRIEKSGNIMIAGRNVRESNISIVISSIEGVEILFFILFIKSFNFLLSVELIKEYISFSSLNIFSNNSLDFII